MINAIELAKEDYNATMLFEREEGMKEGTQKTQIKVAKELLKENLPLTTIERVTGLSAEMIDAIDLAKEDYKATLLYERQEGFKEGFEEAVQKSKMDAATELMKENIPLLTIEKITGLSAETIRKIQNPDVTSR